ncbi:hypothetical protein Micbo1qcDRAFT_158536, partial [Microdochium bolleyi]
MLRRAIPHVPRRAPASITTRAPFAAAPRAAIRRALSTTAARMSGLPPVNPPVSTVLPSDAFQLLPEADKAGAAEDALYEQQIKDVEAWWASPRYE